MVILKFIGGLLLILLSGLVMYLNNKDKKEEGSLDGIVKESVLFQGYLLALALFALGFGIIWSVF